MTAKDDKMSTPVYVVVCLVLAGILGAAYRWGVVLWGVLP